MYSPCFITLYRRTGEKIIISPAFLNEIHAMDFLQKLLIDLTYFLKFYPSQNQFVFYNDDFILAVEHEKDCQDLSFESFDSSGEKLVEICFEAALDFIEKENSSK